MQVLFNEQYGEQQVKVLDQKSLSIQALIEELQAKLDKAHNDLTAVDSKRQEYRTVNQAAQSALEQLETAAAMVAHTYGAEGLDELSDRIADILSAARRTQPKLIEGGDDNDSEPEVIITPPATPETTTEQDIPTIEVVATEEVDTTEAETEETDQESTETDDNSPLSQEEKDFIQEVTEDKRNEQINEQINSIATKHQSKVRKAAKALGINPNGFKKPEMLEKIKATLTDKPELLDNFKNTISNM